MLRKFPEFVFVAVKEPGENEWLECSQAAMDAVEDDGPTKVATYQLVEVNELKKRVVSKGVRKSSAVY